MYRLGYSNCMTLDHFFVPPGHFYSPIFLGEEKYQPNSTPSESEIPMSKYAQFELLRSITGLGHVFPKSQSGTNLYFSDNDQYGDGDAFIFSGIVKFLKPKRVIEIGSGFSTAVLLDTLNESKIDAKITAIDPYPQRLEYLLKLSNRRIELLPSLEILAKPVQDVDLEIFSELHSGDILFIDSSHVSKTGSDVNFELFDILPKLNSGVWVHIHDMFWPFEYPDAWIEEGRSWNELYMIRAFLTFNSGFRVKLFQHYLFEEHKEIWNMVQEKGISNPGGGLWLEKI